MFGHASLEALHEPEQNTIADHGKSKEASKLWKSRGIKYDYKISSDLNV
jgi:hypothetical protein